MVGLRLQVHVLGKPDKGPALAAVDCVHLDLPDFIWISWAQDGQAHMFFLHSASQLHVWQSAPFLRIYLSNIFLLYDYLKQTSQLTVFSS